MVEDVSVAFHRFIEAEAGRRVRLAELDLEAREPTLFAPIFSALVQRPGGDDDAR